MLAYDTDSFTAFLHGEVEAFAGVLGWSIDGGSYIEAINDTLLHLSLDDIALATDFTLLRNTGRLMVWRRVVGAAAAKFDFSADGGSYSLSDLHSHAMDQVRQLERILGSSTEAPVSVIKVPYAAPIGVE